MGAKTTFRRLWSILLALVLVVGMMPTTALAEGETPTQVTATADFSADPTAALVLLNAAKTGETDSTWDSTTNAETGDTTYTLTLNGVNFTTTADTAVKLPADTTIVLNGENTITSTFSGSDSSYGIYADGSLAIKGSGNLTVTGGDAVSRSCGIYTETALTISSGIVTAISGDVSDGASLGIYSRGNMTISGTADVTAIGGTAKNDVSFGINSEKIVNISGGTVRAISGEGLGCDGIYSGSGSVTISGGNVEAIGGTAGNGWSVGIYAQKTGVTISGTAEVTVIGGKTGYYGRSYGFYTTNKVTMGGGTVTIAAEDALINGTLNVTGNGFKTINFSTNTGSGVMIAYTNDTSYTLPENGFTPSKGQRFKCWSVDGNEKAVGATITVTENTTLKAVWEYIEYTLTVTDGVASSATATMGTTVTLTADTAPSGQVFDQWVVESGSTSISFADATSATTTFEMPDGDVIVKATYATPVSSVAITGIDAPVSNTILDTAAVCETTGVSTTAPTVTWDTSESKAGYYKDYTASITLTVAEGYKFTDDVTATVNGNPATSVTKNANGTLTVTYKFPKTDKHNIEITVDTEIRDGDAAKNPTINSGYEFEFCFFVEDTDKDGVFIDETTGEAVLDDKTFVVDKALVEKFAAQSEGSFTYESLMAALKSEFGLDELKTEFTDGYDYSVFAYVYHIDRAYFARDDEGKVTNAIVKVNGEDITDSCQKDVGMLIMPGAYVFTTTKTYTVSFEANGGTGTMTAQTGVRGEYTLPANSFTAPAGKQFKAWSVDGVEKAVGDKITVAADTTVKAVWEDAEYTITVTDGKATVGGTGVSKAAEGTKVTLTANAAPSGKVFDKWVVVSGSITLADANSATTTFTMPASAVSVKATYKNAPEPTPGPTPVPAAEGKVISDELGNSYKVTKSDAKNGEVTYAKPNSSVKGTVEVPDTVTIDGITYKVTAIEADAFKNNSNITKVIIGNNVTVIGKNAFSGCTKLKTVKLGSAVTTIGDKAFYKCTSLTSITIPANVTKIGKSVFEGCKKLKKITVKSTKLKSVGKKALKGIHAKAKIKVPKSKLTKYKSLFKNKGQGKKVKVTK